jgi:uncharacterized protein (TIGR03435 family)
MNTAYFNVEARVPEGAKREDLAMIVRHLLEERFKLAVHREQKEVQGYDLAVANGKARLRQTCAFGGPA